MRVVVFARHLDDIGAIASQRLRAGESGAVIVRIGQKDLISFYGDHMGSVMVSPADAALPKVAGDFRENAADGNIWRLQRLYESALILYASGGAPSLLSAADRMRRIFRRPDEDKN